MTVHVLHEYESRDLGLSADAVDALVDRHSHHLDLSPAPGRGQWAVSAKSYVGSIVTRGETFHIRPKARLRNLLAMMDVEIASEAWQREVTDLEGDPDLATAMARLFCVASEYATASGLRRAYRTEEDLLVSPRGRIDLAAIARRPGLVSPVPCRFDEHTADIPLNRLLKAAIEQTRRVPALGPKWKHRLRAQLAQFADVTDAAGDIDWVTSWQPTPMERHYATAARLAHLIITGHSVRNRTGSIAANAFLLNMNDLFEKWVTARLHTHAHTATVRAQHGVSLGVDGEIPMNPDVTVWRGREVVGVADCKYKLLRDGDGRSSDYYQALAYATALGLDEAWLIYARFPGDPAGGSARVRNSRCVLHTIGLDLTGPLVIADETLARVAGRLGERTPALSGS